jgi:hypothetical protein
MTDVKIPAYVINSPCATAPGKTMDVDAEDDRTPLRYVYVTDAGEVTDLQVEGRQVRARVSGDVYTHELVEVDDNGVPTYQLFRP